MATPSAQEKIFFHGRNYFAALLADINAAKVSIELETYIFALDQLGKKFIDALTKAAQRGVKVKVLVDGAGTSQWGGSVVRDLEAAGAETRVFHPFPWRLWQWSRCYVRAHFLLKAIYLLLNINSRNHRKVCIIDYKIAYVGSFNITQDHLGTSKQDGWRDTAVRLESINLSSLIAAFAAAWAHTPIQERLRKLFQHIRANPIIRLNNTWYRRHILYKNLLRRIRNCQQKIWITNAYFVPDNFLLRRLREAAVRGIDVRILLPQKSDIIFMPWASNAFYEKLLKAGVRLFEYKTVMLHAKTLIIDNWMLIGSSNLNHRSLLHDLEVDINIRQSATKHKLQQQFLLDLQQAQEIHLEDWLKRRWYQHLVGRLLLYLKYFI